MHIIAIGRIDAGHEFIGPFASEEDANTWLEDTFGPRLSELTTRVLHVHTPQRARELLLYHHLIEQG